MAGKLGVEPLEDVQRLEDSLVATDAERWHIPARRNLSEVPRLLGRLARVAAEMNPLCLVSQTLLLHPKPNAVAEGAPGVGVSVEDERDVPSARRVDCGPHARCRRHALPGRERHVFSGAEAVTEPRKQRMGSMLQSIPPLKQPSRREP